MTSTSRLNCCLGLGIISVALTSCTHMSEDSPNLFLVASEPVPVFATKEQSIGSATGKILAIMAPSEKLAVIGCIEVQHYDVYKVRLPDGQTGFVNDGHYSLRDKDNNDATCDAVPRKPQLDWGWVTNCAGPEFSKVAQKGAAGPGPDRPVFRLDDQLMLAIPKANAPSSQSIPHEPRTCVKLSDLPPVGFVQFYFQGDWSTGYKPEDLPLVDGKPLHPDVVWVRIEPANAPKMAPEDREAAEAAARKAEQLLLKDGSEFAGLTCGGFGYCRSGRFGDPDRVSLKYQMLNGSFGKIYADYGSPKYGGTRLYWIVSTSDLRHWRDIDAAIWKLIADWNLSERDERANPNDDEGCYGKANARSVPCT